MPVRSFYHPVCASRFVTTTTTTTIYTCIPLSKHMCVCYQQYSISPPTVNMYILKYIFNYLYNLRRGPQVNVLIRRMGHYHVIPAMTRREACSDQQIHKLSLPPVGIEPGTSSTRSQCANPSAERLKTRSMMKPEGEIKTTVYD